MPKSFIVKALNPTWKWLGEYDELGVFSSKKEARRKKLDAQNLGFIKVCIKQRKRG